MHVMITSATEVKLMKVTRTRARKPVVLIHVIYKYGNQLYGRVYGHPTFTNGTPVLTSLIKARRKNGRIETVNTVYHAVSDSLYC